MKQINRRKFLEKTGVISSCVSIGTPVLASSLQQKESISGISREKLDDIMKQLSGRKPEHPSIHFDSSRLKDIRRQVRGTHQRYADQLYQWVEKYNKTWDPPEITGGPGNEVQLEESGAFLTNASLAFSISRNQEYLEIARKWALEMCEFPRKAIRNYGIGIYVAGLARAYDWLYHDLEKDDRDIIKNSITEILGTIYMNAQPGAEEPFWWTKSYIHHDFCIPMGGFGEASLAMLGEIRDAEKYAAFAKVNFDVMLSWIGEDGGWHEGVADWCYAMAPLLWFYGAWESITGENLHDNPWIRNTAGYRLYHRLTNDQYINLNDSFRSGRYSTSGSASCHLLRRLASIFKDGHAQWLAEKDELFDLKPSPKGVYQAPYEKLSFQFKPVEYPHPDSQPAAWNVLWYDPSVQAVPPDLLPAARHFDNLDIVIMRTGWAEDDAVVSFSCGPLAGHTLARRLRNGESFARNSFYHDHADYSSFTLFANGQYFIIPPGYARRASRFQNVVNVNGADYRADPALNIRIEALVTEKDFSYSVGDATEGFLPQLGVRRYKRHILLLSKKWLIIYDDLKLSEEGRKNLIFNRFGWAIHCDPDTHRFVIDEHRVKWQSLNGGKPLHMYMLEPQEYGWEREIFQSKSGKPMMETLKLSKPEFYGYDQRVLTAWTWDENAEELNYIDCQDFIAVLPGKEKAIAFAKKSGIPSEISDVELSKRELLLFGTNTDKPALVIQVTNGKIK